MVMKFKPIIKKLIWKHKCFWGNKYRIIENEKVKVKILVYHRSIYILEEENKWVFILLLY